MFLSYRNLSIDLLCHLNNWFLCDENIGRPMWNCKTVIPNKAKEKMKKRKFFTIITKKYNKKMFVTTLGNLKNVLAMKISKKHSYYFFIYLKKTDNLDPNTSFS